MQIFSKLLSVVYFAYIKTCKTIFARSPFISDLLSAYECKKSFFTPLDFFLLMRAVARYTSPTKIISFSEKSNREQVDIKVPVTIIVVKESFFSLIKMCNNLSKQNIKDYQLIIIGIHPKRSFRVPDCAYVSYIETSQCPNDHELFSFSLPYIKGNNVCFLRSSDEVSPYFGKIVTSMKAGDSSLVVFHTTKNQMHFVNKKIHTNFLNSLEALIHLCSIEHEFIYNALFSTTLLKTVVEKYEKKEKFPLQHILQLVVYVGACNELCVAMGPLVYIHSNKYKYFKNKLQLSFFLKLGMGEIYRNIENFLDKKSTTIFLEHCIMHYVPQVFSCKANKNFFLVLSHCMHSNLAFYIALHYRYSFGNGKELFVVMFNSLVEGNSLPLVINKGIMSSRSAHAVHLFFLRQNEREKNTVIIYDDEYLHDLENHLSPKFSSSFTLLHIKKITFLHSKQLEIMVHAVLASYSKVIVSSQLVHKNIAGDTPVIQAWHGSGFLKVTTFSDTKWVNRADYMLISSIACKDVYSKAYKIPASKLLPFGTIQSDRYYNEKEIALGKERALNEFPDLVGKKICFFAPTFRQYTKKKKYTLPPHYMCYWNCEEFDKELEKHNIVIVFKHHPKIKSYQSNRSKLHSDLVTSPHKYIRETCLDDIYDWICACDYFMTDYSSAMLYAMLVQKKLIFYAPDFYEYMNEGNGMYINFKEEAPGPIITSPSATSFIDSLHEVSSSKYSEAYSAFKYKQMNLCHGRACKQLKGFLVGNY